MPTVIETNPVAYEWTALSCITLAEAGLPGIAAWFTCEAFVVTSEVVDLLQGDEPPEEVDPGDTHDVKPGGPEEIDPNDPRDDRDASTVRKRRP